MTGSQSRSTRDGKYENQSNERDRTARARTNPERTKKTTTASAPAQTRCSGEYTSAMRQGASPTDPP
ncbi:hypothetical protein L2X98_18345 [Microbacterium elymi]|uniref:Uncharacterized protein n=1 Tax=Microbacterium elymi TaxID=2909587 RepID=A0ABY5NJN4_9MICO|nr:hypothetical protein [Microbacterium elymi]UUT35382.1 hypothetical protein L2X98_18345 [Microbacterium elymi]